MQHFVNLNRINGLGIWLWLAGIIADGDEALHIAATHATLFHRPYAITLALTPLSTDRHSDLEHASASLKLQNR